MCFPGESHPGREHRSLQKVFSQFVFTGPSHLISGIQVRDLRIQSTEKNNVWLFIACVSESTRRRGRGTSGPPIRQSVAWFGITLRSSPGHQREFLPDDFKETVVVGRDQEMWFLATRPQGQPDKRTPAVCLPPRAQLLLKDIPKSLRSKLGIGEVEAVKFIEICAEANTYRDRCVSRTAANFCCKLSPRDNESRSCR